MPLRLTEKQQRALIERVDSLLDPPAIDLILDYEKTLSDTKAQPSDELHALLYDLVCMEDMRVTLMSQASPENLDQWFGEHEGLCLVSENTGQYKIVGETQWRKLKPLKGGLFFVKDREPAIMLVAGHQEGLFVAAQDWAESHPERCCYTIKVKPGHTPKTSAHYSVPTSAALIGFLSEFCSAFQINCYKV